MGQAYSAKPKQNRKNRNIQPGNFIIVVDPDEIFERSILEEPSILAVNASYPTISSRLPLGKIMSTESFPNTINLREDEKVVNVTDNLSNNSSLGQQSQSRNKKSKKYKNHTDSEIELASLSLSQQRKREEKIKKICTCKFIITSDISSHEQTLQQKLQPTESQTSGFSEKISDEIICKNISEQVSDHCANLPNSLNKQGIVCDEFTSTKLNQSSDKLAKVQTPENPNSPTTSFYKYENSKITMLSSVLRVPTQERLKREFGGPLPEKTSHKEMLAKQSSESSNDFLEDKDEFYTCPFCGATASSLLTPENFAKLSSLKESRTFITKPTADDESFRDSINNKSISTELLNLRETAKQKAIQGELAKSKLLKRSKALNANFVSPTRDDATFTSVAKSREESSNILSEKLLSQQYTPEKLYISLKRTEKRPRKSKEQDKCLPKSIMKMPYDCPGTAECCKEPLRQVSEQLSTKSEETTGDSSSAIDETFEIQFSRNNLIKPPLRPKDSFDSFNQNLKRLHEKKARSVSEKSHGEELPNVTSSHASAKSFPSRLDKLTLQSVNKSSFKPLKVSYAPNVCCEPSFKVEKQDENQLEKPSKIIVEISGSVLPKNIMEQLTRSHLKTYISSQGALPEELLKPLSNPTYQDASFKQTKEVTNIHSRPSYKSSIPRRTVSPPPELKSVETSQQQFENFSDNYSTLATSQLTQTNDAIWPKAMKKHLKKSQIFLSTTKPQSFKNVSRTVFEELHKFPKQVRVPQTIYEKPFCCHKLQQQFTEKLAIEEDGSLGSTSRESIQSQLSDLSELSGKSFASDASDASQLSTSVKRTSSKRNRDPYDNRTMLKKKSMLKHVKEHLSRIKEISPNGSHKSLSSSASDVSLTLKEKQLLNKQSLSDQSLRKGQESTRHRSQLDELEMQKKTKKTDAVVSNS
ncbi:hypothetical protein ILUMI_23098 [Ignelater luminosus]|uniref:Uncharacterized protein n=1 Tax=Ignelater luminosus TaxID=2038154 RepID=A0A8K0C8S9_IGNLU|nr:hypothetical protein ILUMI_23098 [Ignelater luminosus]